MGCYQQQSWNSRTNRRKVLTVTNDEARKILIEAIDYAAYRETESSLYDSDKNRLYGSEYYNSGRIVERPSPWAEGNFEKKMATLLRWATTLNASSPKFTEAQSLLRSENSVMGRVIRRARRDLLIARFLRPLRVLAK
jgi:hypothetical protein